MREMFSPNSHAAHRTHLYSPEMSKRLALTCLIKVTSAFLYVFVFYNLPL